LGRSARHGTGSQSRLPLQDRGDHAQQPQLGYQRAQQVPADQRHAHRQWLRQAQGPQLPHRHHGRDHHEGCRHPVGRHGRVHQGLTP